MGTRYTADTLAQWVTDHYPHPITVEMERRAWAGMGLSPEAAKRWIEERYGTRGYPTQPEEFLRLMLAHDRRAATMQRKGLWPMREEIDPGVPVAYVD